MEDNTAVRQVGVNVVAGAHSHNDFLRALVETGVPGLVFFTWLLFGSVRACSRSLRRAALANDALLSAVAVASLCAASVYLLVSFDSNLMTQVAVSGTMWAIAAVGHASGRIELTEPRSNVPNAAAQPWTVA